MLLLLLSSFAGAEPTDLWRIDTEKDGLSGPIAALPTSARAPLSLERSMIDPKRLAAGVELRLPLTGGRSAVVATTAGVQHPNGDSSVRLTAAAKSSASVSGLLTVGSNGLFGRLRADGRLWLVHSDADGAWLIDTSHPALTIDAFHDDALVPGDPASPGRASSEPDPGPADPAEVETTRDKNTAATVIDVMFVYPDAMVERYPGELLDTRINHLVAIANQALADSGVPAMVRVVLTRPVGPLPTDDNREMLGLLSDALAGNFVPGLANLGPVRNQVGADLVVLTWPHDIETRGSCGIAFFPRDADDPDAARYGVHISNDGVSNWSICSDAVFTHELGHNLNARHQQFPGDDPNASNYAFVRLGRLNTVMGSFGTGDPNRFLRLDRFSSPATPCGGGPCGSTQAGDRADNAAELRRRLPQIAGYRGGVGTATAPAAVDGDSDGDGRPDSVDPYPLDPADGQAPSPPPPPEFVDRRARLPADSGDFELLVVDSARDAVLSFNLDGSFRGEAASPQPVDALPVLTEFSDLAVDDRGLVWLLASADVRRYDRADGQLVDVFLDSERPQPRELLSPFPRALGFDPSGGLVVLGDTAIERFDADGQRRDALVEGNPSDPADWNTIVDLPLRAFAFGADDRFYLAEAGLGRLLVFDASTGRRLPDLATAGQLRNPRDLVIGSDGRVYVADADRVLRFDPARPGQAELLIPPGRGGLAEPRALAFGPQGDLFVADRGRGAVLRFDATSGAFVDEAVATGVLDAAQALAVVPKLRAVRAGHSGHWFDPARAGEGWLVEVLPDGRAAVLWFTYPDVGEPDEQLWLTGAGTVEDDRIVVPELLRARGARFGPGFDPADVELTTWGSLILEFDDCDRATARWNADAGYGSGERSLQRLARLEGLPCEQAPRAAAPDRPGLSGQWYDPSQDGQGWLLQEVRPGELLVAWFTYDDTGRPAWIIGTGTLDGRAAQFDDLFITRGTRFGAAFDPGDVALIDWGSATWTFDSCSESVIEWTTDEPGFVDGRLDPVRFTRPRSLDCSIEASR